MNALTVYVAVWPAVGKAPNGVPDTSVAFGDTLSPGQSVGFGVADTEIVRSLLIAYDDRIADSD